MRYKVILEIDIEGDNEYTISGEVMGQIYNSLLKVYDCHCLGVSKVIENNEVQHG